MKFKKYAKPYLIVILAILGVIAMNFIVIKDTPFLKMFFGENTDLITIYGGDPALDPNYSGLATAGIFEFIALCIIIKRNFELDDKILKIFSLITGIIFSVLTIISSAIILYSTIKIIYNYRIIYSIKFIGLSIVYYNLVLLIFDSIKKFKEEKEDDLDKQSPIFFTNNKRTFFLVLLILIIAWIPYFLNDFPGSFTWDAYAELNQITGKIKMDLTHSFIHVEFVRFCMFLGNCFGDFNIGAAIYTSIQMLIMGAICSYTIYYLAKKQIDIRIRIAILVFFAFFPIIPIMNVIIQKDTLFAGYMLLFLIAFFEILTNYESVFKSKLKMLFIILAIVLINLSRKNVSYAIAMTIPFLILYICKVEKYKKYRIKITSLVIIPILAVIVFNSILGNYYESKKTDEEYRINAIYNSLIQQVVRATIDNEDKMEKEEIEKVYKFFPNIEIGEMKDIYAYYITDIAKGQVDQIYFREHTPEFMSLYFEMLFKYPISFIDSFLCTTSGYYDIEESRLSVWTSAIPNDYGIQTNPIYKSYFITFIEYLMNFQNIPLIGIIFSTAFPMWVLIALIMFNLYNKKYNFLILVIPIIMYFGTILLGPLNGEMRYIFYMYMCLPFLTAITLSKKIE